MRLRDWVREMTALPAFLALQLPEVRRSLLVLADEVRALRTRAPTPALATLTVLCERWAEAPQGPSEVHHVNERVGRWVPTVLGAEAWLLEGQTCELRLMPQQRVHNFRWFVSGDPTIVVTEFVVANERQSVAFGGLKYGDSAAVCNLGNQIRVTLERRAVPS